MNNQIKYRLTDKTIPCKKFYRSIDFDHKFCDNGELLDWYSTKKDTYEYKCHWGQRKLMYSEIEFLTIVSKHYDLKDCLVVYAGSANGIHINIFTKYLFPQVHWLLYDPAPFQIDPSPLVKIKTGKEGYFTDDTVEEVLRIANGKKILFISDIRMEPKDELVLDDMLKQQRWGIMLKSVAMMLKLRFPFVNQDDNGNRSIDPKIQHRLNEAINDPLIKKYITYKNNKNCRPTEMIYLDGKIQIQLYPPSYSAETRLIAFAKDGKYNMKLYNCHEYENMMLTFNEKDRVEYTFKYNDSDKLKEHIIGFDDGYESVAEYIIIKDYIQELKNKEPTLEDIVKTLYLIDFNLRKLTKRSLLECNLFTLSKLKKQEHLVVHNIVKYRDIQRKSIKLQKTILQERLKAPSDNILSVDQYKEQIKYLKSVQLQNIINKYLRG